MIKPINCSAIILRAKPEFEQWLANEKIFASIQAEMQEMLAKINLSDMRANGTVIFVPLVQKDTLAETDQFIKAHADTILAQELDRWGAANAEKPAQPAMELLNTWFEFTHHTNVFALQ